MVLMECKWQNEEDLQALDLFSGTYAVQREKCLLAQE